MAPNSSVFYSFHFLSITTHALITFTFNWFDFVKVNPDPYVECDPEVDIDKAQAEEDANYFDEEDLGNRII